MSRTHKSLSLVLAILVAIPCVLVGTTGIQSANADVTVRVRGSAKVRVGRPYGTRYVYGPRYRTARPVVRLRVSGGVYVGPPVYYGRFAAPPPPPPAYDCPCEAPPPAPAYAPPAPAPVPVYAAPPEPERLPRFGVGVFAGASDINNRIQGEDVGLVGRLRLTDSFLIEGEFGQSELETQRVDRRLGGTLIYDVMPRSRLSLQLLGGMGVTQVDLGDGTWQSDQQYGELGLGLSYRLTRNLHLSMDARAGALAAVEGGPSEKGLQAVAPSSDEERFSRVRFGAMLYF